MKKEQNFVGNDQDEKVPQFFWEESRSYTKCKKHKIPNCFVIKNNKTRGVVCMQSWKFVFNIGGTRTKMREMKFNLCDSIEVFRMSFNLQDAKIWHGCRFTFKGFGM